MSPVILDFRNRALVERIVNSDVQKIYVTYGAEHIPGLLTLLEAQPKPWKVLSWNGPAPRRNPGSTRGVRCRATCLGRAEGVDEGPRGRGQGPGINGFRRRHQGGVAQRGRPDPRIQTPVSRPPYPDPRIQTPVSRPPYPGPGVPGEGDPGSFARDPPYRQQFETEWPP